jgi:chemotaxis protein methyltransferase CheR
MELSDHEFGLLRSYIQDLCGITLPKDKSYLIQQRLESVAVAAGCKSFGEFYLRLKQSPQLQLQEQVINAITTNETSFFRDEHPFIAIAKDILPQLGKRILERKVSDISNKGPKASIWSAGSSTGQEPYSLAMLIHEYASANRTHGISLEDFRLIATDISSETLKRAKTGEYSQMEIQRGLSPDRIEKFFNTDGIRWIVKRSIHNTVHFKQINLDKPFIMLGEFDLILCRNVLIYFDLYKTTRVLDQFHEILSDNGFLVLGVSENLYGITDKFVPVQLGETRIYQKSSSSLQ